MHIAVIIPAYNAAAWLADCLGSLRAQMHADWSAIVIDDGSSDGTGAVAEAQPDARIRLVQQTNAGVSAARNRGIRIALGCTGDRRADAVLFLDADDWLDPDALTRLAETLEASPWAVAAAGAHAVVRPDGQMLRASPPPSGCLLARLLVRNLFVNGGQLLICREAIEAAGLFRPDLPFGEDWEYWTRLATLGEFASLRRRTPVLYARERPESAYRRMATDPGHASAVVRAIHSNPSLHARFGSAVLDLLRNQAEADSAWIIGREHIRHGRRGDGRRWLRRSLRQAPNMKRAAMVLLSPLGIGPFRPYRFTEKSRAQMTSTTARREELATISP